LPIFSLFALNRDNASHYNFHEKKDRRS